MELSLLLSDSTQWFLACLILEHNMSLLNSRDSNSGPWNPKFVEPVYGSRVLVGKFSLIIRNLQFTLLLTFKNFHSPIWKVLVMTSVWYQLPLLLTDWIQGLFACLFLVLYRLASWALEIPLIWSICRYSMSEKPKFMQLVYWSPLIGMFLPIIRHLQF